MKYLATIVLSLLLLTSCKKNNDKPNTTMTVYSESDATWTSTNVLAFSTSSTTLSISATNPATHAQLKLGLYEYREGHKIYYIDYRNTAGSINSATYYTADGEAAIASIGSITISNFTTKTIEGSFEFTGSQAWI